MFALVIWTIVASVPYGATKIDAYDWRVLMETNNKVSCEAAAKQLNLNPQKYRCIAKS